MEKHVVWSHRYKPSLEVTERKNRLEMCSTEISGARVSSSALVLKTPSLGQAFLPRSRHCCESEARNLHQRHTEGKSQRRRAIGPEVRGGQCSPYREKPGEPGRPLGRPKGRFLHPAHLGRALLSWNVLSHLC